jgi:hypothetical protein
MMAKSHEFEVVLQPEEEAASACPFRPCRAAMPRVRLATKAIAMAKDAIEGYLEVLEEEGGPLRHIEQFRLLGQ